MTSYIKYNHHNPKREVTVREDIKGKHRKYSLCYSCAGFKPGTDENCSIAAELYHVCVKHDLVTPVFECPLFTEKK